PTAASAAATVITKNTNTWPSIPTLRENATNARLTAFSINSMHMKRMIALRRTITPSTPIENRITDSASDMALMSRPAIDCISDPPLREQHGADDRHEQQYADELERDDVITEQRVRDRADRIQLLDRCRDLLCPAPLHHRARRADRAPGHPAEQAGGHEADND